MNILELITEGEKATQRCKKSGEWTGYYYSGAEYSNWLNLATRFVEAHYPNDPDTIRFRNIAEEANGYGDEKYLPLIGILKAFNQIPPQPAKKEIVPLIKEICLNFQKFEINIKRRYGQRDTIHINDEYDLQDALFSIMRLFVSDLRREDYVPSHAGSNSRVDFLLPEHGIIIEIKMTNNSLRDKQIGEQLLVDFERYKQREGYNHLICFVYDKESYISNPAGLICDLEKRSDSEMQMTVIISPQ